MDLQRKFYRFCTVVQIIRFLPFCLGFLLFSSLCFSAPPGAAAQQPGLIRDTGVADAADAAPEVKAPDPILCEKNINIGDFYYKKKNYAAAIGRYLEAIAYQTNSIRAYDALARAYQKNDELAKAVAAYKQFIEKNPDSPQIPEIRTKIAKLEKDAK
jgi:tetratricopeptide (TPR) repeat protein